MKTATLGGGCFWCLEAVFSDLKGVENVISGYAGGLLANPSYQQVCSGRSGHAEVIQIQYNSLVISFQDLLRIFFVIHNPTTLNRQGGDVGPQYRSVIFYGDPEEKTISEEIIMEFESKKIWNTPIVTEVVPL